MSQNYNSGGDAGINQIKVTLQDTQILALHTTPYQFIDAPGVGYAIQILTVITKFNYISVTFDMTDAEVRITGAAKYQCLCANLFANTANMFGIGAMQSGSTTNYLVENAAAYITAPVDGTVGNGSADFFITYRIIQL